ncbi:MAG: hypothetical protein OXQ31_02100 [Spirochaetaceae bacterium]|nr:hypothetical protein [Spirochaetaceae bacterium]
MAERQLSFTADEVAHLVNRADACFREGAFAKAIRVLERALRLDAGLTSVASALKCAMFWQDREARLATIDDPYERAEYLEQQWELFQPFARRLEDMSERTLFDIRRYVMTECLRGYRNLLEAHPEREDADLLLRIGRTYKGLGNYASAIEHLETASRKQRRSPEILAELADCYGLVNEDRFSRVLFREAFFIGAESIHLERLEAPVIRRLIVTMEQAGRTRQEIASWLPVYATLHGVFTVKRELKPLELGRLKQTIFAMERQVAAGEAPPEVTPGLLNHYFWLIDHFIVTGEAKPRVREVLTKIRDLDRQVHDEYVR